jgi:hypothetical protein
MLWILFNKVWCQEGLGFFREHTHFAANKKMVALERKYFVIVIQIECINVFKEQYPTIIIKINRDCFSLQNNNSIMVLSRLSSKAESCNRVKGQ